MCPIDIDRTVLCKPKNKMAIGNPIDDKLIRALKQNPWNSTCYMFPDTRDGRRNFIEFTRTNESTLVSSKKTSLSLEDWTKASNTLVDLDRMRAKAFLKHQIRSFVIDDQNPHIDFLLLFYIAACDNSFGNCQELAMNAGVTLLKNNISCFFILALRNSSQKDGHCLLVFQLLNALKQTIPSSSNSIDILRKAIQAQHTYRQVFQMILEFGWVIFDPYYFNTIIDTEDALEEVLPFIAHYVDVDAPFLTGHNLVFDFSKHDPQSLLENIKIEQAHFKTFCHIKYSDATIALKQPAN